IICTALLLSIHASSLPPGLTSTSVATGRWPKACASARFGSVSWGWAWAGAAMTRQATPSRARAREAKVWRLMDALFLVCGLVAGLVFMGGAALVRRRQGAV